MNIHKFYPLQEPQPEELDEAYVDAAFNLIKRFSTITQPGIVPAATLNALAILSSDSRWTNLLVSGETFHITQNGSFAVNIGPGMAFSRNAVGSVGSPQDMNDDTDLRMERIFVSPADAGITFSDDPIARTGSYTVDVLGNPTPVSTGCVAVPVAPSATTYIYIKYLSCVDTQTTIPGTLGNNYTLNPQTGRVEYVHWLDGYRIITQNTVSTDPDVIYVATITADVGGIINISTTGRTYFSIPGALVTAQVTPALIAASAAYPLNTVVSFTDHINAVADSTAVSKTNPHGTTIEAIPGLVGKFGAFSDSPQSFYTNGIVDTNVDVATHVAPVPGPFWAYPAAAEGGGNAIRLTAPSVGQSLCVSRYLFTNATRYYSQVWNGSAFEMKYTGYLGADFPGGQPLYRPAGWYFVYLQFLSLNGVDGAQIKADTWTTNPLTGVPTTMQDMVEHPGQYLTEEQFPVGIVYFDTSNFTNIAYDPWTRYAGTFYVLDVRKYGTISPTNISHDRRVYTNSPTENPQLGNMPANDTIYSDHIKWIAQGPALVVTDRPIVQAMVKKAGRIRRITMFSDTLPVGGNLMIDITKNGRTHSVFATHAYFAAGITGNAYNFAGTTGAAAVADITENGASFPGQGQINPAANYVNAGDRLQLFILQTGTTSPGGDDLLVMIYIE